MAGRHTYSETRIPRRPGWRQRSPGRAVIPAVAARSRLRRVGQRMKKPGAFEKMFDLSKSNIEGRPVKGRVFNAVFRSQSDPDEIWSVVGVEDEVTYRANANNPQTSEAVSYTHLRAHET